MPPGPKAHGSGQDEHSKKILILIFKSLFCEEYFNPAPDEGQYIEWASCLFCLVYKFLETFYCPTKSVV